MVRTDLSTDELKHKAESYCAAAEHCTSEVKEKLFQWGANEKVISTILAHLQTNNYINDIRYCQAYAHDKLLYQGWGRIKIQMMLHAKSLPEEAIREAVNNLDHDEYIRILKHVAEKKKGGTREQVIRFLLQRGFEYEVIRAAIAPK